MKPGNFQISISKEELNALPVEKFDGEIIVVNDDETAEMAAEQLEKANLIGFDTETKPAFKKGQINRVALLQLATDTKCFLIRLCRIGLPQRIKAILENPTIPKIGLSIKDDFHSLAKICNINPEGFTDLQDYVRRFRIADSALTRIHAVLFGRRISKGQQLSNWEAPELTRKQQEYAAIDALACINIYKYLESGEFNPVASPYCQEICREEN